MIKIKFFTIGAISTLFLSCTQNVSSKEFVGEYALFGPSPLTNDTLIINDDATFLHCGFLKKENLQLKENGKWKKTVNGYYELKGYHNLGDIKPVKNSIDGNIKIFLDPNQTVYYRKIR